MIEEQGDPPLGDRPQLGQGELGKVEGEGDRLAVEVAAADDAPATRRERVGSAPVGKDERVIGRAVELDREPGADIGAAIALVRSGRLAAGVREPSDAMLGAATLVGES